MRPMAWHWAVQPGSIRPVTCLGRGKAGFNWFIGGLNLQIGTSVSPNCHIRPRPLSSGLLNRLGQESWLKVHSPHYTLTGPAVRSHFPRGCAANGHDRDTSNYGSVISRAGHSGTSSRLTRMRRRDLTGAHSFSLSALRKNWRPWLGLARSWWHEKAPYPKPTRSVSFAVPILSLSSFFRDCFPRSSR